jgi:Bardet-Biedl syndrome 4 protein
MLKVRLLDNKPSEWLAHRFYVLGQFDMCLSIVGQILRKTPENAEALSLKGSVLRTKGQIDEAMNCFQTAYNIDSENLRHRLEIAKCLFFLGRYQQSLKVLREVQQSEQGNTWEVYHLLGLNLARLRQADQAIENFENALDAHYRLETVLELIGVLNSRDDADGMANLLPEASNVHGNSAAFRRRVGHFDVRHRRFEDALGHFAYASRRDPRDCQSFLYGAAIEQENQRGDCALDYYRRAFQGLPNSPALWNNVGLCIQVRSRREAVVACCQKASFLAPFEAAPLINMGLIFLEMGMYCSAAIVLRRAVALDGGSQLAHEGLAIALMNLHEFDEAIAIFEGELKKSRTHSLLINFAICLYRAGRLEEAGKVFQGFVKVVEEEPTLESLYPAKGVLASMLSSPHLSDR